MLKRFVLAAKKGGFGAVQVAGDAALQTLLDGTDAVLVAPDTPPPTGAATAPARLLGEVGWLSELAARPDRFILDIADRKPGRRFLLAGGQACESAV